MWDNRDFRTTEIVATGDDVDAFDSVLVEVEGGAEVRERCTVDPVALFLNACENHGLEIGEVETDRRELLVHIFRLAVQTGDSVVGYIKEMAEDMGIWEDVEKEMF